MKNKIGGFIKNILAQPSTKKKKDFIWVHGQNKVLVKYT